MIDRSGKVIASQAREHAPIHSEHIGWAEQDPENWWEVAQAAIGAAIQQASAVLETKVRIEAAGLTGQMHGAVMMDADGRVLRPR